MAVQLTYEDLADLMKSTAGVTVDPDRMRKSPETPFADYGLDSLALLGIVGELENRHGVPMPTDAERCKTPREFVELVSSALTTGA